MSAGMSRKSKKRRAQEEAEREELLAPDAFESQGRTWAQWFEKNMPFVLGGLGGVLLLIIVFELVATSGQGAAAAQTRELVTALDQYRDSLSLQAVLTSTDAEARGRELKKARAKLAPVISNGSAPPDLVRLARLYDADMARRLGLYREALAGFDAYLEGSPELDELGFFALEGKGYALEAKGDNAAALKVFERLASTERWSDYGLKHVARVRQSQGDLAGARTAYEKIIGQDPASPLKDFAEQQLAALP
ncbi:MAG: hypothetical protein AAFZ18_01865 [Myxococcota bacterium]